MRKIVLVVGFSKVAVQSEQMPLIAVEPKKIAKLN